MSLFSAIVKVTVETVKLPVAIAKDAVSLGIKPLVYDEPFATSEQLDRIKKASEG